MNDRTRLFWSIVAGISCMLYARSLGIALWQVALLLFLWNLDFWVAVACRVWRESS